MKKLVLLLFIGFLALAAVSQNIQTHYDMGKERHFLTTTVEMFKPDKTGNTFFFIDMNYGDLDHNIHGVSLAYWEISRSFNLGKSPFAAHIEYNGGMGQWKTPDAGGAYQINNAYLGGVEYSRNAKDFSSGFTIQTLFKSIQGKNKASFQLTGVWYVNFLKGKMRFDGFADFWKEDNNFGTDKTTYVFLSEPQIWYNVTSKFAVGSEEELGYNFTGNRNKGFYINPTIALKYTF